MRALPLFAVWMVWMRPAYADLNAVAETCRADNTLHVENVQKEFKALESWRWKRNPVHYSDELDHLISDAALVDASRPRIPSEDWGRLVTLWSEALLRLQQETNACPEKPTALPPDAVAQIQENVIALTSPVSLPVMAAFDSKSRQALLEIWKRSPTLVVSGAVELPFNVLAAGPRLFRQYLWSSPCENSQREANQAFLAFKAAAFKAAIQANPAKKEDKS